MTERLCHFVRVEFSQNFADATFCENRTPAKTEFTVPCCLDDNILYYIPITDTTLELFFFWPSDTESRINELRFSESISQG